MARIGGFLLGIALIVVVWWAVGFTMPKQQFQQITPQFTAPPPAPAASNAGGAAAPAAPTTTAQNAPAAGGAAGTAAPAPAAPAPAATAQNAAPAAGGAAAPAAPAASADASRTGTSHLDDVVMARQLLMDGNESAMMTIETGKDVPLPVLQAQAYAVYTYLTAFPHMFPPESKPVTSPDGSPPATAATAAVWDDFATFYKKSMDGADAAFKASQAKSVDEFMTAAKEMRASCDSCHMTYMHVVDPSQPPSP